ncbi:hypothetical protein [Roseiflexus sp. RS-1]|jgi:uncharacterized membrane protein YeaQ/YmgE (transglycosylase-associated protein family)|uniref:hypothetical protein n=1 Tax=Roseiflexus sp. (strain RS-1) TaxID=357808 RepID=UPI0000D7F438|nr:hypothetical protein [Roseiflexus sp. RS-1]ABQ92209.1 hypothetical protein RoseRS_3856 [Roseiflexus sp. RS-1]
MAYLIWTITGVLVAALLGAALSHSMYGNIAPSTLAGVFGALLGGIIGSGIVHADHTVTLPGALGAVIGASLFVLMSQAQSGAVSRRVGRGNPPTPDD